MSQTFTINMLKTFDECPKKYEYAYVKKIRIPENSKKTLTGNKLHSLINFHLKKQDIAKLLPLLDEKERLLWENFEKLTLPQYIDSEYSFHVKFSDFWLTGRIDAIFKTERAILIADWKTSDYILNEKEQFQTMFYLYSIYNIYKSKGLINEYRQVSMTYYILSDSLEIKVELSEGLYNEFCEKMNHIIEKINIALFEESPGESCRYCNYRTLCKP